MADMVHSRAVVSHLTPSPSILHGPAYTELEGEARLLWSGYGPKVSRVTAYKNYCPDLATVPVTIYNNNYGYCEVPG
mgnify:CR=1 FL=1